MAMYRQPVTCQSLKIRLCLMRLSNIDTKHMSLATQTVLWPWKHCKRLFHLNAGNWWWTTSNNGNGIWSSLRFTSLYFTHSLTQSLTSLHSLTSLTRSLIRSLIHSLTHTHSLTHSITRSLTHLTSLTSLQSLTHSLHSLTHSLTHFTYIPKKASYIR